MPDKDWESCEQASESQTCLNYAEPRGGKRS